LRFQSNHTGIETEFFVTGNIELFASNRTILELKPNAKVVPLTELFAFQSNHTGIETFSQEPQLCIEHSFQSNHTGIETTIAIC